MGNEASTTAAGTAGFTDPAWLLAASLQERRAAGVPGSMAPGADPERAGRRLARWRAEPAFGGRRERFEERLLDEGITEDELRNLLAEPAAALRDRLLAHGGATPEWLTDLAEVFGPEQGSATVDVAELLPHDAARMLFLVEPVVVRSADEVGTGLTAQQPELLDATAVLAALLPHLCGRLIAELSRTVVLELQVARLGGRLRGDTPQERFREFVAGLRDRGTALRLLREYPVLARSAVTCARLWTSANLEVVRRFAEDRRELVAHFFGGRDPGRLTDVGPGAGDPHRGGRSVCVLRFESGQRLVYKPHSLAADHHFQHLLRWLNDKGAQPSYRVLTVLDKGEYGWEEYAAARACTSHRQVERFYRRQGGYLALLYCLHAADFHYENLVAAGEHPVLVDLEALFHPDRTSLADVSEDSAAMIALDCSVLMTGLLPQRRTGEAADGEPSEFSGLGGAAGQLSPVPVAAFSEVATDAMRVTRRRVEMPPGQHQATLSGSAVDVLDHVDDVLHGFESVCALLRRHRDELLAPGGPIEAFADDEVRCVVRPTQAYMAMLSEGTHPDLLRDGLARDRYFDNLWASRADSAVLNTVFPCERHDLYRRDVPVFTTRPAERHLWCTEGHQHPDVFREPVLSMVRQRIARLGDEDVRRQAWIIRASFTALILGEGRARWPVCHVPRPRRPAGDHELLEAACRVADRLELLAVGDAEAVGWIGLTLLGRRVWSVRALGGDLYGGLSGLGLFLAHLGEVTHDSRYSALAERSLAAVRDYTRWGVGLLEQSEEPALSTFEQAPGGIYALTHLGVLWRRDDLVAEAEELARRLGPAIGKSAAFDIVNGTAGFLCVLLGLHEARPGPAALDLALRCGDLLLSTAETMPHGIAWRDPGTRGAPLAGFSHGASGVAYALLRLAEATGEERFRTAAARGMEYERQLFVPEEGNWPDLREFEPVGTARPGKRGTSFMTTWCHGAPGVGLARLQGLNALADPFAREELRKELDIALDTTTRRGLSQNHSLCHGSLGNIELLAEAARALGSADLRERTRLAARGILDGIERYGWQCGVPGGVETPGLMTGLAGIGYGLLRLAAPQQVPSVLTLSAPSAARRPSAHRGKLR